jgi:pre-mRNA-processing factor 17
LGAVNTVTFIDENRRFVSSSDDKSLRVWEFGIPVQIKYVADPSMHSMPAVTPNPAGTAIICQSLDNQVSNVAQHTKMPKTTIEQGIAVCGASVSGGVDLAGQCW